MRNIKVYWRFLKSKLRFKDSFTALIIFTVCAWAYLTIVHYTNWRFEKPNEIGDSSGLANGLFSALAFAVSVQRGIGHN